MTRSSDGKTAIAPPEHRTPTTDHHAHTQIARLLRLALPTNNDGTGGGERSLPTLLLGVKALLCLYDEEREDDAPTIPHLPSILRRLLGPGFPSSANGPLLLQWSDCAALLREEEARARVQRATAAPRLELCGGQPSALGALHVAGAF